jgi:deazaflavin-dependent oxidoreductase (nitroreductase family)
MRRSSTGLAEHRRRYGRYDRVLQRFGHVRPFTFVIRYAGSKVDRALYRASRGRVTLAGPSLPTMLLTTRGRRTGEPRTVPVFYVRDGDNLVAASENFGLAAAASWPGNLRADPYVTIQVGSTSASYRARPATAAEVDRAMPRLLSGAALPLRWGARTGHSCSALLPSSPWVPMLSGEDHRSKVCGCEATDAEAAGRSALEQ